VLNNPLSGNPTWSTVDARVIDAGSAVMYQPGKILRAGSSGPPGTAAQTATAAAYTLDMTAASPSLVATSSMHNARAFLNLTMLPDGTALATGGEVNHDISQASYAVHAAEVWSPDTGQWTTLASNVSPRYYHSTSVLLPDGRILNGGGWGPNGGTQTNFEIFSPPYLFKGARPSITSAPSTVTYNSSYTIGTPDAASITKVALIPPAAVTHNFDENNRYVPLSFTQTAGGLQITTPPNANYAPPGPYMLWIVNSNGVPSVARWVNIG
jgi:galactose oxidase-like protein